ALFLAVVSIGLQTGRLVLGDIAAGASVLFIAMCVALLALAILFVLGFVWDVLSLLCYGIRVPWLKFDVLILTGCAILTAVITLVLKRWSAGVRCLLDLSLGALSWWLALTLVTAWYFPGSSYLFVWPTLFGVLGLGL